MTMTRIPTSDAVTRSAASVLLSTDGDVLRISVAGDVDLEARDEFSRILVDALDRSLVVELDLTEVRFMDSAGVNALLTAARSATADHSFTVGAASPQVTRLFEITGLAELFFVRDEVEPET